MAVLTDIQWPPEPITTKRLRLRATEARDRDGYIEMVCSDEVRSYLGGPRPREHIERVLPEVPANYPGVFAVELDHEFIGCLTLDRRDIGRRGHIRAEGNEIEVSYTFLPYHWGNGYATEATTALLQWVDEAMPGEPVVLCTQTANVASVRLATRLGFVEKDRFVEFGAEQWFGVRAP